MARRRRKRVKSTPVKKARLTKSLIVGFIVVAAVAFLGFTLLSKKTSVKLPAPVPAPTPTLTPIQSGPTPSLPVKKLPDTASEPFSYTVAQNDSLYAIGMTFCDDKTAWVYLAQQNNLVEPYILHKGETLTLSCP